MKQFIKPSKSDSAAASTSGYAPGAIVIPRPVVVEQNFDISDRLRESLTISDEYEDKLDRWIAVTRRSEHPLGNPRSSENVSIISAALQDKDPVDMGEIIDDIILIKQKRIDTLRSDANAHRKQNIINGIIKKIRSLEEINNIIPANDMTSFLQILSDIEAGNYENRNTYSGVFMYEGQEQMDEESNEEYVNRMVFLSKGPDKYVNNVDRALKIYKNLNAPKLSKLSNYIKMKKFILGTMEPLENVEERPTKWEPAKQYVNQLKAFDAKLKEAHLAIKENKIWKNTTKEEVSRLERKIWEYKNKISGLNKDLEKYYSNMEYLRNSADANQLPAISKVIGLNFTTINDLEDYYNNLQGKIVKANEELDELSSEKSKYEEYENDVDAYKLEHSVAVSQEPVLENAFSSLKQEYVDFKADRHLFVSKFLETKHQKEEVIVEEAEQRDEDYMNAPWMEKYSNIQPKLVISSKNTGACAKILIPGIDWYEPSDLWYIPFYNSPYDKNVKKVGYLMKNGKNETIVLNETEKNYEDFVNLFNKEFSRLKKIRIEAEEERLADYLFMYGDIHTPEEVVAMEQNTDRVVAEINSSAPTEKDWEILLPIMKNLDWMKRDILPDYELVGPVLNNIYWPENYKTNFAFSEHSWCEPSYAWINMLKNAGPRKYVPGLIGYLYGSEVVPEIGIHVIEYNRWLNKKKKMRNIDLITPVISKKVWKEEFLDRSIAPNWHRPSELWIKTFSGVKENELVASVYMDSEKNMKIVRDKLPGIIPSEKCVQVHDPPKKGKGKGKGKRSRGLHMEWKDDTMTFHKKVIKNTAWKSEFYGEEIIHRWSEPTYEWVNKFPNFNLTDAVRYYYNIDGKYTIKMKKLPVKGVLNRDLIPEIEKVLKNPDWLTINVGNEDIPIQSILIKEDTTQETKKYIGIHVADEWYKPVFAWFEHIGRTGRPYIKGGYAYLLKNGAIVVETKDMHDKFETHLKLRLMNKIEEDMEIESSMDDPPTDASIIKARRFLALLKIPPQLTGRLIEEEKIQTKEELVEFTYRIKDYFDNLPKEEFEVAIKTPRQNLKELYWQIKQHDIVGQHEKFVMKDLAEEILHDAPYDFENRTQSYTAVKAPIKRKSTRLFTDKDIKQQKIQPVDVEKEDPIYTFKKLTREKCINCSTLLTPTNKKEGDRRCLKCISELPFRTCVECGRPMRRNTLQCTYCWLKTAENTEQLIALDGQKRQYKVVTQEDINYLVDNMNNTDIEDYTEVPPETREIMKQQAQDRIDSAMIEEKALMHDIDLMEFASNEERSRRSSEFEYSLNQIDHRINELVDKDKSFVKEMEFLENELARFEYSVEQLRSSRVPKENQMEMIESMGNTQTLYSTSLNERRELHTKLNEELDALKIKRESMEKDYANFLNDFDEKKETSQLQLNIIKLQSLREDIQQLQERKLKLMDVFSLIEASMKKGF